MKKLFCAVLISTLVLSVGCRNVDRDNNMNNNTNPDTTPNITDNNNATTENLPQTNNVNYVDGVYKAEMGEEMSKSNNGWKDYVEVTIKDNKINNITFDSKNTEGKLRSEDKNYTMEPTLGQWIDNFINRVMEIGDIDRLDGIDYNIKGSENYRKLLSAALNNAKSGNKEVAVVTPSNTNNDTNIAR